MSVPTIKSPGGQTFHLGRIPPARIVNLSERYVLLVMPDGREKVVPRLGGYYRPTLRSAPIPPVVDWTTKAMDSIKRMYLNDQYGDCVIASKYHQVGVWTGNTLSAPTLGTDAEVLNSYHGICGAGDNGCVITDVLDYQKSSGLSFGGVKHKITDYVSVDWGNKALVQTALDLFGSICLGINLPSNWTCSNCDWGPPSGQIVGGHDVPAFGYNDRGVIISTWGGLVTILWAGFLDNSKNYIEEAYVSLSPDWFTPAGISPGGINMAALTADLQALAGGQVPPIPDPVPPGPTPGQVGTIVLTTSAAPGSYNILDLGGAHVAVLALTGPLPAGSYAITSTPAPVPGVLGTIILTVAVQPGQFGVQSGVLAVSSAMSPGITYTIQSLSH